MKHKLMVFQKEIPGSPEPLLSFLKILHIESGQEAYENNINDFSESFVWGKCAVWVETGTPS